MVPVRGSHCQLDLAVAFLGRDALQVFVCSDIRALPGVADLSNANDGLSGDLLFLEESRNIRDVVSEDGWIWTVNLLHPIQRWPEVSPEPRAAMSAIGFDRSGSCRCIHMPPILAIGNCSKTAIRLHLDSIIDALIRQSIKALPIILLLLDRMALIQELLRTKQRAQMLCAERRVSCSGRHGF